MKLENKEENKLEKLDPINNLLNSLNEKHNSNSTCSNNYFYNNKNIKRVQTVKSGKNRFSSVELSEKQKLKLYNSNRIYNDDDHRKVVEEIGHNYTDLTNNLSPFKARIGTSKEKFKRNNLYNINNSNINNTSQLSQLIQGPDILSNKMNKSQSKFYAIDKEKSLMNKSTSSFFKEHAELPMAKSSSNFFQKPKMGQIQINKDSKDDIRTNNIDNNVNNNNSSNGVGTNHELLMGTTYDKLYNSNLKNFGETFNESFFNHNEKDPIFNENEFEIVQKDINSLLYHYSNSGDKNRIFRNVEDKFRMEALQVFPKYQLGKKPTKEEMIYINKIVTEKGIINPVNNKVIKQAFQGSEPNFMNSDDVYFKNPQLAYETLIHNKDIHDIINNFRIDKQINSFKEKYIESVDIENKVKSMPKIKVTLINKKKKPFDDDDETKQAKAQAQALLEESLKKEIGGIVKANEFGLSREAMMQNTLELHGAFITNQNVRPSGRIFATLVITNTVQFEAILWGGVNSYKLEDLWKLRIIHEKNGNYININQLISINMNIF